MAQFDKILSYKITAKAVTPLHIGCSEDDGFILTDGTKPYIQANSISGAFGAYAEQKWGKTEKEKLFGGINTGKSKIVFSDGEFKGNIAFELRPHVRIDCKLGTALNSSKFDIQLLGTGALLEFEITVFQKQNEDFSKQIESLIFDFNVGNIILGGQKTNGCGSFKVIELSESKCDMYNEKQRNSYFNNELEYKPIEICKKESDFYNIVLKAEIIDSLIVKSGGCITRYNNHFADCETIKNSNEQYIVPASSVKGVIKNHIKAIVDYMNMNDIFLKENKENGKTLIDYIYFDDAIITNSKTKLIHRIKIDKFTGGTFDGGKFDEIPVTGDIEIKIKVKKDTKLNEALVALVLYCLRDIACGVIGFGGLSSIGRGFVKGKSIEIDGKSDNASINDFMIKLKEVQCNENSNI